MIIPVEGRETTGRFVPCSKINAYRHKQWRHYGLQYFVGISSRPSRRYRL